MTVTTAVFIAHRLLVPLTIFRWPFFGAILAIIDDALDVVIATLMIRYLHTGDVWDYARLDKYCDTYYLFIEWLVAFQRWPALARWTATVLFWYRAIGVVVFEVTDIRVLLFFFPAIFDFYFLFYAGITWLLPQFEFTPARLLLLLIVVTVPKMAQEYALHYKRWLDNVVAVDVIRNVSHAIIDWFRGVFGAVF